MNRKVCVVTGSRAEYGLLQGLMKAIKADSEFDLQLIVTGMHLSPEFGLTYQEIEQDGFIISEKVDMLLSADNAMAISKSMGLGMIGLSDALHRLRPDIVVVLGDRFEMLSVAIAAMNARIPIAHIHGGELTLGAIDDAIRHAISKMAYVHFTATECYRQRVIQLGEHPKRVFNVGALGVQNIKNTLLLDKEALETALAIKFKNKNLLITFHPATLNVIGAKTQFEELLKALSLLHDTCLIFTKSNADTGGREINQMIDDFIAMHSANAVAYTSLGNLRYLSLLQFVDGVIGNSSSGLIEVPSFKKGTINIGDRQEGRVKPNSVIDCASEVESIQNAIMKLYSDEFNQQMKTVDNPYEGEDPIRDIIKQLKALPFAGPLKKSFYDIPFKVEN